jgi:hypothetical protein
VVKLARQIDVPAGGNGRYASHDDEQSCGVVNLQNGIVYIYCNSYFLQGFFAIDG